jgi:hypothetical protein
VNKKCTTKLLRDRGGVREHLFRKEMKERKEGRKGKGKEGER